MSTQVTDYTKSIERLKSLCQERFGEYYPLIMNFKGRSDEETWAHFEWMSHCSWPMINEWLEYASHIGAHATYDLMNNDESPTGATDPELALEEAWEEANGWF